jgi:AAA+ superfamily predicted ATPase
VKEKNRNFDNILEVIEELHEMGNQRAENELDTVFVFAKSTAILRHSSHLPLVRIIKELLPDIRDQYFYLYLIWETIGGKERIDIADTLERIYDRAPARVDYMQKLLSTCHILMQNDLLEIVEARFFNDTSIKLTEKSLDLLSECEIKLFVRHKKRSNVLSPDQIPVRELIFKEEEMKQLELLKKLLHDNHFAETQNRLASKNLPKGITALLHGAPGTGKTESVLQIARETEREIMKIDISQSKSMWFGESEKIIKRVFTDYKSLCKACERTPILFFNEADAILSKRVDVGSSNVAQTENTIQNILLEELENFEGILLATTNLAKNFDPAFERRFLFKIEFQKPDTITKAKIWKLKIPILTADQFNALAVRYNFSGGQIDNIVRKTEIHEIIHGLTTSYETIIEYCNEELLQRKRVEVGFR